MKSKRTLIVIISILVVLATTLSVLNAGRGHKRKWWNWWSWNRPVVTEAPIPTTNPVPTPVEPEKTTQPEQTAEGIQTPAPEDNPVETVVEEKNKLEVEVILVNSTGDKNILWVGDSTDINTENELSSGEIKSSKVSLAVENELLKDTLVVNCAQGESVVSAEKLDIEGNYIEGKPVVIIWDGNKFSVTY